MLAPLVFLKSVGSTCTNGIYFGHCILDFLSVWVFNSADYYSSMKDKYPIFYVSSSYFSHINWHMQTSKRCNNSQHSMLNPHCENTALL